MTTLNPGYIAAEADVSEANVKRAAEATIKPDSATGCWT